MKTKKKLLVVAVLCLVFALSAVVLATNASFSETMPSIGHKTLATGVKSSNLNAWSVSISNATERNDAITIWIDANGSPCLTNQTISRGQTLSGSYTNPAPGTGSNMALRTQPIDISLSGGWRVIGTVNFN